MSSKKIEATASAHKFPLIIKQLLLGVTTTAPDQEIVYADRVRYTYSDFSRRIGRLANGLVAFGGRPGATVAMMDWDSHRYLECYFAVPMMGAVLQTVNVRLSPEQILFTLEDGGAEILLVNRDFLPIIDKIRDRLTSVKIFILLGDEPESIPDGFAVEYETLLAASNERYQFPDLDEDVRATLFHTTGTTGDPKGVCFSHRQLVLHTLTLLALLGTSPRQGRFHRDDVYMPLTPMFHVHAWGFPYAATMAGVKQVYPGRYRPEVIGRLLAREGVTISHCVPTILQMLLQAPACEGVDLSRWKVVVGGSALSTALASAALKRGIDVFTGYGMSETCPVLALARVDTRDLGPADVAIRTKAGRPSLLVDMRVVGPDMRELPRDGKAIGEVVVRAPWLVQGYLGRPDASEALWAGGWLHTQDVGTIDSKGYLQITDRIKDVIKTGGEWVSSLQIEEIISQHPSVAEVAVIGVTDEVWGERPKAFVVLRTGQSVDAKEIRRHVMLRAEVGQISKYGVPDQVEIVDALPRTSVGKLNKRSLRHSPL